MYKKKSKSTDLFHGLKELEFRKMMNYCTKMSHFQFGGLYFDQIDGVAMGSPLAPTLASVFVSHFENKFHEQLKELGVDFWARYVDDIFAIIKDKSKAESILNFLNNWHKNLRFTTEVEVKKKLPFLDVLVENKSCEFRTTIYRKKTYTGVLLNWNSLTARKYKINLIKCLLDRIWKICTDYELINIEILKIKQILLNNDYPIKVIDDEILDFLNKKYKKDIAQKDKTDDKKIIYLVLPYLNRKVEVFGLDLENLVKKFYNDVKLEVVFQTVNDIGRYAFRLKVDIRNICNHVLSIT
jgi:hypothetical protein